MNTRETYIAFLRGINVGGNKRMPMAVLKRLFESLGFENVRTLLNSGNIVFSHKQGSETALERSIEMAIRKKFGFESKTIVRTAAHLEEIITLNPFKNTKVSEGVRMYVTFLHEESRSTLRLPYASPGGDLQILGRRGREVFSVMTRKDVQSIKAMDFLEKEYGKDVTTRNWNTIEKIADLCSR